MRVLSLFSGIGALDYGLQNAGFEIVGQCEIEEFPRRVLQKHWPNVPKFKDVQDVTAELVSERCGRIDLIAGGFPCQDISVAGHGQGISGARSGLYWQIHRLANEIQPAWLLLENVPALRTRGADEVLLSLAQIGYVAWPFVVGAWAIGAPHKRQRVWIVAYRDEIGWQANSGVFDNKLGTEATRNWPGERLELGRGNSGRVRRIPNASLLRMDDGFASKLDADRVGALGNAVVPQIVEVIGRAILQAARRAA